MNRLERLLTGDRGKVVDTRVVAILSGWTIAVFATGVAVGWVVAAA